MLVQSLLMYLYITPLVVRPVDASIVPSKFKLTILPNLIDVPVVISDPS